MSEKLFVGFVASVAVVLGLALAGYSQTGPDKGKFPGVKIKNFGQMDERFFRGAQPKKGEYQELKELGIETVIDLQAEPTGYEKSEVEALGMRYINIPIIDKAYPSEENIAMFLKTVDDPQTGIFYAHCAGGRHRTGDMGALYRFSKYGWSYDKAYEEMKNYDFYTSWGHGRQKDFVVDYAAKMQVATAAGSK